MAPMKAPRQRETDAALEDTYSLTHLAHRWGVSRKDVRQLLQDGELPFVQILGQLRVPVRAVELLELGERHRP